MLRRLGMALVALLVIGGVLNTSVAPANAACGDSYIAEFNYHQHAQYCGTNWHKDIEASWDALGNPVEGSWCGNFVAGDEQASALNNRSQWGITVYSQLNCTLSSGALYIYLPPYLGQPGGGGSRIADLSTFSPACNCSWAGLPPGTAPAGAANDKLSSYRVWWEQ